MIRKNVHRLAVKFKSIGLVYGAPVAWSMGLWAAILSSPGWAGEAASPGGGVILDEALQGILGENEAGLLQKLRVKEPRDRALKQAVTFLLKSQRENGSYGEQHPTAFTGLAVMAMMAVGQTPDDPVAGEAMRKGIRYVLSQMGSDGYFGQSDNSRMYGHGICTLMLLEAAGMTKDKVLERRIVDQGRKAIRLILAAQGVKKQPRHLGGWRYEPTSGDSDLSLTGWQTMALRAGKDIGVNVPQSAIDGAVGFIRRMASPQGGFGYEGPEDRSALRGVGLLTLSVCGAYDAQESQRTAALILKDPPTWKGPFMYYSVYYSSVGMYQVGGDAWEQFYPLIDKLLLEHQNEDGSWPPPPSSAQEKDPVYMTSMAVLSLAIHHQYLPIYQR